MAAEHALARRIEKGIAAAPGIGSAAAARCRPSASRSRGASKVRSEDKFPGTR